MSAGTAYAKRYGAGFVDLPTKTTPVDQQFLNAVEAALLQLIGSAPTADGQVAQWDNANTRYGPALILNKNVDAAAAIAKSKLDFTGANGLVNADVAGAAAIARSKLNFGAGLVDADIAAAAAISLSKLASVPVYAPYRKVTSKQVINTVTETDLLNGEITIGGGVMGASSLARLTAWGDWVQNSGGSTDVPRWKLKLGATTLIDTNIIGALVAGTSTGRKSWRVEARIMNLGATNSQVIDFHARLWWNGNVGIGGAQNFTTGEGIYAVVLSAVTGTQAYHVVADGVNTAAVDTTAANVLALTTILPTANASVDITLKGACVEVI